MCVSKAGSQVLIWDVIPRRLCVGQKIFDALVKSAITPTLTNVKVHTTNKYKITLSTTNQTTVNNDATAKTH